VLQARMKMLGKRKNNTNPPKRKVWCGKKNLKLRKLIRNRIQKTGTSDKA
jgi:hypothetical protein